MEVCGNRCESVRSNNRTISQRSIFVIKINKKSACKEFEVTPEKVYKKRRQFMKGGAVLGAGLALGNFARAANASLVIGDYRKSVVTLDEELTDYKDATRYNNFYEFGTDKEDPVRNASGFNTDDWKITVSGACENPGEFALEDLIESPEIEERIYRLRCVETWSMVIPWLGVPLDKILKRFKHYIILLNLVPSGGRVNSCHSRDP